MIRKFFPELNLDITERPISDLCSSCYKALQRHFGFIKKCLQVEEAITEYCKVKGTNSKGQVDLSHVAQFTPKKLSRDEIELCTVKQEEICLEFEENLQTIDEKSENSVEIKQEFNYKMEYTEELKSEDTTYDRYSSPPLQHNATRPHKCPLCQYSAKRLWHLKQHELTHKSTSEVETYICATCDYETKNKGNLVRHMLTHKATDEVNMNKCSYPFCNFQTRRFHNLRASYMT